ncbi:MAG: hypothetical protein E6R08_02900 [Nevskiaceae bacterium]|nr:MAG: hypothetical protein E6R08_02900 [Nevskiaceae bacterium]
MKKMLELSWVHFVVIGVVLLLVLSFSGIFKGLKGLFGGVAKMGGSFVDMVTGDGDVSKQVEADLAMEPEGDTNKMTITEEQAAQRAMSSYVAMQGLGTDEDALFRAVEDLNGEDLQAVRKAFGAKAYYFDKLDLFGWYTAELDEEDKAKMRGIWSKAPVPYV